MKALTATFTVALLFSAMALFQSISIVTANPAPYPTSTPNTTPPIITIQSPSNSTIYNVTDVQLNFSVAKPSWDIFYSVGTISYTLDGERVTLWTNPEGAGVSDWNYPSVNGAPVKELSTVLQGLSSGEHILQVNVNAQYEYRPNPNFFFPSYYPLDTTQTILFTVNSTVPPQKPTITPNLEPFPTGDVWPMFLYNTAHTGYTTSAAATKPLKLWSFAEGDFDGSSIGSSAAVANGIVYVGSNYNPNGEPGGGIYAFNASTGGEIWNYSTHVPVYSSPAVSGNMLFIGGDVNVYALNAFTGTKVWNFITGGRVDSSPSIVDGVVYIGSDDGNVYALNALTGAKMWSYDAWYAVYSSPAVVNGVVYIGPQEGGNVIALNASTGKEIWNRFVIHEISGTLTSSPAVSDGIVYIGSIDGDVYALNASTGNQIWNYTTEPVFYKAGNLFGGIQASPTVAKGVVYIGSTDGNIYALNALTGTKIWNYTSGSHTLSSPAVTNGMVYVGCGSTVYCLNAKTGAKEWEFPTGNQTNSSPAVVNGIVYIASEDGNFYAIGKPASAVSVMPFQLLWIGLIIMAIIAIPVTAVLLKYRKNRTYRDSQLA